MINNDHEFVSPRAIIDYHAPFDLGLRARLHESQDEFSPGMIKFRFT